MTVLVVLIAGAVVLLGAALFAWLRNNKKTPVVPPLDEDPEPRRVPSLRPAPSAAVMPRSGSEPEPTDELTRLLRRFRVGTAPYFELVPPLTKELIDAQRAGRPFAIDIVRSYTDRLYVLVRNAIGAGGEDQPSTRHAILAPDGRIASAEDLTQPAVPLMTEDFQLPFNLARLDDIGTHPDIHLRAAVRALSSMRSAEEVGGSAEFLDVLDRTWFLLAFWLSASLGYGQMLDPDRALIVDLVECCSHLHALSGTAELPAFVIDAIDRELEVQHFDQEWVTVCKVMTTDGKRYDEGRYVSRNTERPLRAGALLREHYRRDQAAAGDPGAVIAVGRLKAESGDHIGARAAFEQLRRSHPAYVHHAEHCLRDLLPEEACQELVSIFVRGSPLARRQAETRVKQIGQKLNDLGGMDLMLHVHSLFRARRRSDARSLEVIWGGIGNWRG